jgi:hypothetical protein
MDANARNVKGQVLLEAIFCAGVFFGCIYFAMYNMREAYWKRKSYDRIGHWSSYEKGGRNKNEDRKPAHWFKGIFKK